MTPTRFLICRTSSSNHLRRQMFQLLNCHRRLLKTKFSLIPRFFILTDHCLSSCKHFLEFISKRRVMGRVPHICVASQVNVRCFLLTVFGSMTPSSEKAPFNTGTLLIRNRLQKFSFLLVSDRLREADRRPGEKRTSANDSGSRVFQY